MITVTAVSQDDSTLVTDCLKGNHEAFETLVGRYQSLICSLIYSRCGNVSQSEDLAHRNDSVEARFFDVFTGFKFLPIQLHSSFVEAINC